MILLALVKYTVREVLGQKTIILLVLIVTLMICLFAVLVRIQAHGGVIDSVGIYGREPISVKEFREIFPQASQLYLTVLFTATIIICSIATSHIIPHALMEGTRELILVLPLSRSGILLGKYLGVIGSVALLQCYFLAGFGIAFAAKVGSWKLSVFFPFIPLMLAFSSLYAFIVFLGVASRSTGFSTAIALIHSLFLSRLIAGHDFSFLFSPEHPVRLVPGILRYALPPIQGLQEAAVGLLDGQPLAFDPIVGACSSTLFMLFAANILFRRMDF